LSDTKVYEPQIGQPTRKSSFSVAFFSCLDLNQTSLVSGKLQYKSRIKKRRFGSAFYLYAIIRRGGANRLFNLPWCVPQVVGFRRAPVQIKVLTKAISHHYAVIRRDFTESVCTKPKTRNPYTLNPKP